MDVKWVEVTCQSPSESVEQLADFLVTLSGNGVCIENLALDTFSLETVKDGPVKAVKAYLVNDAYLHDKINSINAYMEAHIAPCNGSDRQLPTIVLLQEEDWANNWKIHFKPSRIGKRIIIKPTWEDFNAAEDDVIIELDPGMAFGTGTHPTSRLCLETLERIFTFDAPLRNAEITGPPDLLDVGTGSGILAIAAAKLGAGRVIAIDIDPKAINVAILNIELNRTGEIVIAATTPLKEVSGSFDVVVANILAEDLVRMAKDLVSKLRTGGFLVLSGILTEKEGFVIKGFADFPLDHVDTTREEEWSCISYRLGGN
jgi:ribosomal protein L11 methyltransferase